LHNLKRIRAWTPPPTLGYILSRADVPRGAIITALDGDPTPDLAAFAAALRRQRHAARVPLEFFTFNERHRKKSAILQVADVIDLLTCITLCFWEGQGRGVSFGPVQAVCDG
jgi:hypothetical protein